MVKVCKKKFGKRPTVTSSCVWKTKGKKLKESQTSEAAQKAVIYDSISIENVNSHGEQLECRRLEYNHYAWKCNPFSAVYRSRDCNVLSLSIQSYIFCVPKESFLAFSKGESEAQVWRDTQQIYEVFLDCLLGWLVVTKVSISFLSIWRVRRWLGKK